MNRIPGSGKSFELVAELCHELVMLARREDDSAAAEASRTPYWAPCPASVEGHRAAARVLRAELERLEREMVALRRAS